MGERYLYIKIPYQDTDSIYEEVLREKIENKELTLFVKRVLDAYHRDNTIRTAIDEYIVHNNTANVIMGRITNILEEQSRLTVLLDMIQNEVDVGVRSASNQLEMQKNDKEVNADVVKVLPTPIENTNKVTDTHIEVSDTSVAEVSDIDVSDFGLEIVSEEEANIKTDAEREFDQLFESMRG